MRRDEMKFVLKSNEYLEGGTKEACIKVREFLKHKLRLEDKIPSTNISCVSEEEFIEAVQVLMASAILKEDEVPNRWHCDMDCRRTSDIFCPGECNLEKNSKTLCPYFIDESNI